MPCNVASYVATSDFTNLAAPSAIIINIANHVHVARTSLADHMRSHNTVIPL